MNNKIADPSKLRVRGGKNVDYEGQKYKIGSPTRSTRKGKKYQIPVTNLSTGKTKNVHWGAKGYQDYYTHKDPERRKRFHARHMAIKTKDGNAAYKNPMNPAYHAVHTNWSSSVKLLSYFSYN